MNKEELLQRARNSKENQKEGIEQQQMLEGARYGALVFCILMVVLMIYTFLKGRFMESRLVLAVVWLYIPAALYGMGKMDEKGNRQTKTIIFCSLVGLGFLISYSIKSW